MQFLNNKLDSRLGVVEIFTSIEGEGKRTGEITTFIRLAGCNLSCSYCDTPYAQSINCGKAMTVRQILSNLPADGTKNITITGGEPLLQRHTDDLVCELLKRGFYVNIETNGSFLIKNHRPKILGIFNHPRFFFTMDYKLPSSGENFAMKTDNFQHLTKYDVVKFVAGTGDDLIIMENIYKMYSYYFDKSKALLYVGAVFGELTYEMVVNYLKCSKLYNFIFQLQIHKVIWDKEKRGV